VIEKANDRDVVFNIYRDIISGEQLSGDTALHCEPVLGTTGIGQRLEGHSHSAATPVAISLSLPHWSADVCSQCTCLLKDASSNLLLTENLRRRSQALCTADLQGCLSRVLRRPVSHQLARNPDFQRIQGRDKPYDKELDRLITRAWVQGL